MSVSSPLKNNPIVLQLTNVNFYWNSNKKLINNCSLSIPYGGLWMIVGKNGSGKSTLLKLINGTLKPSSGKICCKERVSMVFQNPDHQLLFPSCGTEILMNLHETKNLSSFYIKNLVNEYLNKVGLKGFQNRPIHTLSGGQKQRLSIAGILASKSNLLLFDEPTALLDLDSQLEILRIVKQLSEDKINPITALWITHRLNELNFASGVATMKNGSVGPWKCTHS